MGDGSGGLDCSGNLWQVLTGQDGQQAGAIPDQSAPGIGRQIVLGMGMGRATAARGSRTRKLHSRCSFGGTTPREVPRVHFYTSAGNEIPGSRVMLFCAGGSRARGNIVIGRDYFVRQAATVLKFAQATTNPQLATVLIEKAADLKSQVDESSTTPDPSPQTPDVQPER